MSSKSLFSAQLALVASVILTVILYYVPYGQVVSLPLLYLSTVVHEMGHGIMAMMVGGEFIEFTMFSNGAGVATTGLDPNAKVSIALVSMGGLVGPAFVSGLLFFACKREKWCKLALLIFGGALLVSLALVVKGSFAVIVVGSFGVLMTATAILGSANLCQWVAAFVAVQLSLSVFSRSDYLFTQYASGVAGGKMPSDVQNIASALFFPYWVWGIICGGLSILCLIIGLRTVFRG